MIANQELTVTIKSKEYKEKFNTSLDGKVTIILPDNSGNYEVKIKRTKEADGQ